jgi:hypothetical protein
MSALFILEYGGMPVRCGADGCQRPIQKLVTEAQATRFISEADAWYAAYQNNFSPNLCRVRRVAGDHHQQKEIA